MGAGGPTEESRPRSPWWWIAAGVLALLLTAALVTLWINAPDLYRGKDGAAQATATTRGGILTVAAALIAATAAGAGLYFTARTVRVNQQTLIETRRANREADRRDRYAKAIEQLGDDKAPVRLGAMYSLERLAQDNLELRQAVVDVLCAYLRMPFSPPTPTAPVTKPPTDNAEDLSSTAAALGGAGRQEELLVRQTAQRLLAAHLHPPSGTSGLNSQRSNASADETFWPGIKLDLTDAALVNLDLSNISAVGAVFTGATFTGDVRFEGATFSGDVSFRRATFSGDALFDQAIFSGDAWFDLAIFSGDAKFEGATFTGEASFARATFSDGALFLGATFSGSASFDAATFHGSGLFVEAAFTGGAWFSRATFSRRAAFKRATFSGGALFLEATFTAVSLAEAQVLHIDDRLLNDWRVWPKGWSVCANTDDAERGTLIRRDV